MKTLITIIISLLVIQLSAQDAHKRTLEMRFGYGGADGAGNIKTMSFAYAHELVAGIKIKPSFMMFQGGQPFKLGVNTNNINIEQQDADIESILNQDIQTSIFRSTQWGLGFEKAINTDSNQSLHVMLGVVYGPIHDSSISNLIYTDEDLIYLNTQYSMENKFGYQIDISYRVKVNDYLSVFLNGQGITHSSLITFGGGIAVHL